MSASPPEKRTFMLHDPRDMSRAGTYKAKSFSEAAKKAATRGHTKILLRQTGTRVVHEYRGSKKPLAAPRTVERRTKDGVVTIPYTHKAEVAYLGHFVWNGQPATAAAAKSAKPAAKPAAPSKASKPPKASKKKA